MNNPPQESAMPETTVSNPSLSAPVASGQKMHFNFNKLQAVICIALSAVASVSLIVWAVKSLA